MNPKSAQTIAAIVRQGGDGGAAPAALPCRPGMGRGRGADLPHAPPCPQVMLTMVLTGGFFVVDLAAWIGWLRYLSYIYCESAAAAPPLPPTPAMRATRQPPPAPRAAPR